MTSPAQPGIGDDYKLHHAMGHDPLKKSRGVYFGSRCYFQLVQRHLYRFATDLTRIREI
jgi:hypothetical protein